MALNVNIIGRDSEGNLHALKVNSEGNLELGQLETEIQVIKDNQGRLYGKYGDDWIPIKVDSEGRPIISSDVTVNMEGLVIDVGEQLDLADRPNRELGKVSLSGTIVVLEKIRNLSITAGTTVPVLTGFNLFERGITKIMVNGCASPGTSGWSFFLAFSRDAPGGAETIVTQPKTFTAEGTRLEFTEFEPVKGELSWFRVRNDDVVDRVFAIDIWGVRS